MTPWTAAYQAPLSMGFSRQEYWSGVPLPSPYFNENNIKKRKKRWAASDLATTTLPHAVEAVPEIALSDGSDHRELGGRPLSALFAFIQHSCYVVGADPIPQFLWRQHPCVFLI